MVNPKYLDLVKANGLPAPQHFDARKEEWSYQLGEGGAIYVADKDMLSKMDEVITAMKKEDDLLFIKKSDSMPPAKEGTMVYVIDTSEVYVPYKGKWEVLQ